MRLLIRSIYLIICWFFTMGMTGQGLMMCGTEGQAPEHRPYCGKVGTQEEGWYWQDQQDPNALIWLDNSCSERNAPRCGYIGTPSEGWYTNDPSGMDYLVAVDTQCHKLINLAIENEACVPIEISGPHCYSSSSSEHELFCASDQKCHKVGFCLVKDDCDKSGWSDPYTQCEEEGLGKVECDGVSPICIFSGSCGTKTIPSPSPQANSGKNFINNMVPKVEYVP